MKKWRQSLSSLLSVCKRNWRSVMLVGVCVVVVIVGGVDYRKAKLELAHREGIIGVMCAATFKIYALIEVENYSGATEMCKETVREGVLDLVRSDMRSYASFGVVMELRKKDLGFSDMEMKEIERYILSGIKAEWWSRETGAWDYDDNMDGQ